MQEDEKMQERLEVVEEIRKAQEQIASGDGAAHEESKGRVLESLRQ